MSPWTTHFSRTSSSPPAPARLFHARAWSVLCFCAGAFVLASATACHCPRYAPGQPLTDDASPSLPPPWTQHLSRHEVRLTQRIVVSFPRHKLNLTGYLYLKPNGEWLAIALGDLGTEVLRLRGAGGSTEVLSFSNGLPAQVLRDGVGADIRHLFRRSTLCPGQTIRRADSLVSRVWPLDASHLDEYCYDTRTNTLVFSVGVADGSIVRQATYQEWTAFEGVDGPLPRTIILQNNEFAYSLRVVLLEVRVDR